MRTTTTLHSVGTLWFLAAVLAVGCGDSTNGQGGSAGSGNGGAGGAAGSSGGAGGSGGSGVESAYSTLTDAIDSFLEVACPCVQNAAQRSLCRAAGETVITRPSEEACIAAVFAGSPAATSWAQCETAAYENAAQCTSNIPMCDEMMLDTCSETLGDELDPCVSFPMEDRVAVNDCVTPGAEGLLDDLDDGIEARCRCAADPQGCENTTAPDIDARSCVVNAINVGLDSTNGAVAEDTREALLCASQRFRRWKVCVDVMTSCNVAELDQCDAQFGLDAGGCQFPDNAPELVQSNLDACLM